MKAIRSVSIGIIGLSWCFLMASNAIGQVVATCSDPEGTAYYHHLPLVAKKDSGFQKDKITGGLYTLQRLDNGEYDVLFVDVRKQVISSRQDGARILLLRRGSKDATFFVAYPGMTIELFTFYTDAGGLNRFDVLESKGGDGMLIHKSSVMTGTCSVMNLELVK